MCIENLINEFERNNLLDSLNDLSNESRELLINQGLYKRYVKNLIIKCYFRNISNDIKEELLKEFRKHNHLEKDIDLGAYLEETGVSMENLVNSLCLNIKFKNTESKEFEDESSKYFSDNKEDFDLYTYSLIRVKDKDLATELFQKIESGIDDFPSLASKYSIGIERKTNGLVGPLSLKNGHPEIRSKLLESKIGKLLEPFPINNLWIILRSESKQLATFDGLVKKEIINILFEERLEKLASDLITLTTDKSNKIEENHVDYQLESVGNINQFISCIKLVSKNLEFSIHSNSIKKILEDDSYKNKNISLEECSKIATRIGLQSTLKMVKSNMGHRLLSNIIISWEKGFAIIKKSNRKYLEILSPIYGDIRINNNELEKYFPDGINALHLENIIAQNQNSNGILWFWKIILEYKVGITQVFIAGFVVQVLSLANPLLVQVIIDKVITQRSLDTLQVLGIALFAVTIIEGTLSSLKTFLFSEIANRIDLRIGSQVIDHLLRLPLQYFDKRPVGELSTRIGELEKIRSFLTGQALTTLLDAIFSLVYLLVMLLYSWLLTLLSLLVLPIQILLTIIGTPIFRRQYRKAAEENAKTQSHLTEILTGIETVKSQNIENISKTKWQENYSKYIAKSFQKLISGTIINQSSLILHKLSQLTVLWVGSILVLKGELTLGQLIAFRIISSYVTQPLLRLSNIWQRIQELKVSLERISDILGNKKESNIHEDVQMDLPSISGNVEFKDISFSFNKSNDYIVSNINLKIKQGDLVGIVGESGSGKSTIIKLLTRLYTPNKGKIFIDGHDIQKVDLYSLRNQIGVIPQEPILFSGSISENISLINPDASTKEIIHAAKIAEAHDFIMELPNGYGTFTSERGTSLSGGQRQRIAIARTILMNPRILIMDEATSALDYQTEKKICENIRKHLYLKSIFIVTHRLSTVKQADIILMMKRGYIVETGKHEDLMKIKGQYHELNNN